MELRDYRDIAGITQETLGELVGVTRQTIAAWERNERQPSMQQVAKLAKILRVPLDVMLDSKVDLGPVLLFRADSADALSPAVRKLLTRKAYDYSEIEKIVSALPNLPNSRPLDSFDVDVVEQVANEVRDWLGVEDAPIGNVLALLEAKGLKVILHPLPEAVSGFSAYTEEIGGVIFVNKSHPTERQYFTCLHELSHLIFHRREYQGVSASKGKQERTDHREKAANHLAGAVLLPRNLVIAELRGYRDKWLPFSLLADIKQRYCVSMRTTLVRAGQVGIISSRQSFQQIAKINEKYGKEDEPYKLTPPASLNRLDRLVYQALIADEITTSRAAEVLGQAVPEVRNELSKWLSKELF